MEWIKKYGLIILAAIAAVFTGGVLVSNKKKERKIKEAEDRIAARVLEKEKNDVRIEEVKKKKAAVKKDIDDGKKLVDLIKKTPTPKPKKRTPGGAKKNILDKTKRSQ